MAAPNRRVLLANDLSQKSEPAVRIVEQVENCAQSLSQLFDLPIGYVSVAGMMALDVNQPERMIENRRSQVESRIARFKIKPEIILRFGSAADEIVQLQNAKPNAEIVVMGTRGRTGFRYFWEGSVAEEVIRHSSRPVVVVGPKVSGSGKIPAKPKVVVSTDFGEPAHIAEKYATKMARSFGTEIQLLFCLGDELRSVQESILNSGILPYDFESGEKQLIMHAERDLDRKVAQMQKIGVAATYKIRHGLSVDELPSISKSCDLLIMGTRGRNRLLSTFFGSTARAAILSSLVPVIIVPPTTRA